MTKGKLVEKKMIQCGCRHRKGIFFLEIFSPQFRVPKKLKVEKQQAKQNIPLKSMHHQL